MLCTSTYEMFDPYEYIIFYTVCIIMIIIQIERCKSALTGGSYQANHTGILLYKYIIIILYRTLCAEQKQ